MPNVIEQQICDAIDVLISKRVANLQFDKTVRATIKSIEDASIGKYLVQYQDSSFYAYSDPDKSYKVGAQVYVEIPSSDFNKTKLIIGSVKKLGEEYLTAVTAEQRMTKIGTNILDNKKTVQFCSYDKSQQIKDGIELLENYVDINPNDFDAYKTDKEYLSIGMTVRTALPTEQQVGGGNYGIIMQAEYYTTAQRESLEDDRATVTRTYVLDTNNMLGQPYKYIVPEEQYAIFPIDGKNLKGITSLKAFCKGFPKQGKEGEQHDNDIFLSNFQINFMQPLSQSELSTSSLKILTPYGSYFTSQNDDTKYLEAELKLKGKKVNFNEQKVDFYWFVKDTTVSASYPDKMDLYYSAFAGQGWRCLNKAQTYNNFTQFVPQGYRKHITLQMAPAQETTFKCVAVYNDTTLSATIKIRNTVSNASVKITSSAGTKFYFDTGKTTLTCEVNIPPLGEHEELMFYWGHRTSDGVLHPDSEYSAGDDSLGVNSFLAYIKEADTLITYECTVYKKKNDGEKQLIGSAQITLTNGVPQNEYVLVINNGTQVFKYDEYGVSPASKSVAPADRITIPTLSFDIYDDKGRIVTPLGQDDKGKDNRERQCEIRWIWPDENYTMLEHGTFDLTPEKIINPTTNGYISRQVLADSATLTFEIKNKFDIDATDNNIKLEVGFQGHNLVASTNFTFVKQGQLGTNGTKYTTRIVPNSDLYSRCYIENNAIYGWYNNPTVTYDPDSGQQVREDHYTFQVINNRTPFSAQLWNGTLQPLTGSKISWQILDPIRKTNVTKEDGSVSREFAKIETNISINKDSGKITLKTPHDHEVASIIQSKISSSKYSDKAKYYYATYPIDIAITPDSNHAIVLGGFRQCMYNDDGTRGNFNGKPFTLKLFDPSGNPISPDKTIKWTVSWDSNQKPTGNDVIIEPPAYYDSETTDNYIICECGDYKVIISIYLYLNRYGMAAMNDWDGTSIKLNDEGDQYILAPQIGAGEKNVNDNTFTGITMGKSFGVNGDKKSSEVGVMGFNQGIRTIFLDAKTGKAVFGAKNSSQIVIAPKSYGSAPKGSIYSANYWKWDKSDGTPRAKTDDEKIADEKSEKEGGTGIGNGLLIDLVTPQIKFGSGNFSVNKKGYLVAKGGGSIASWNITDNYLQSVDKKTTLYAQNGPVLSGTSIRQRFNIGDGKFIIYDDGTFKAANDKFAVDQDGTITATAGHIAGWEISKPDSNTTGKISSDGGKTVLYQDGKIVCDNLQANNTGSIAGWTIDTNRLYKGNIQISSTGYIRNGTASNPYWAINNDGTAVFSRVTITGKPGDNSHKSSLSWGDGNFEVYDDGSMRAYSGYIGKWKLSTDGFTSADGTSVVITPNGGLKLGSDFSVTPSGSLKASAGTIGGCQMTNGILQADNLQLNEVGGWTDLYVCGYDGKSGDFVTMQGDTYTVIQVPTGFTISPDVQWSDSDQRNYMTGASVSVSDWAYYRVLASGKIKTPIVRFKALGKKSAQGTTSNSVTISSSGIRD